VTALARAAPTVESVCVPRRCCVTFSSHGASAREMTRSRDTSFAESLVIWSIRRRYLREMRREAGLPRYGKLGAEAVARLSIDAVRHLREILLEERKELRDRGRNRAADSLTSAIRDLDSRTQILNDLLH